MSNYYSLWLMIGLLLGLTACAPEPVQPTPSPTEARAALPSCDDDPPALPSGSILPTFTPSDHCELESASKVVELCMVEASPELSYPCTVAESVEERLLGQAGAQLLIQRDHHYQAGCWQGVTVDTRALRLCNNQSGDSTMLEQEIIGEPLLAPDGTRVAFVAAAPGQRLTEPHLFLLALADGEPIQLDTQPFPQERVVGAELLQWSEDGTWVEVSLWDGYAEGYHRYWLRADGSGEMRIPEGMP